MILAQMNRWTGQSCRLDRRKVSKKQVALEHHCKYHAMVAMVLVLLLPDEKDSAGQESDYGQDEQDESEEDVDTLKRQAEEKSGAEEKGHAKVMQRASKEKGGEKVAMVVVAAAGQQVLDVVDARSGGGFADVCDAAGLERMNEMIVDETGGEVETKLD